MKIIVFNEKDHNLIDQWESFIYKHHHGQYFQSRAVYNFLKRQNYYIPGLLLGIKNDEVIGSLLYVLVAERGIKRFFSRRCIVWGGPIIKNDDPRLTEEMLHKLVVNTKSKAIYTEIRNFYNLLHLKSVFEAKQFVYNDHLNYIVKISTIDIAQKKLSSSKKRQINQSLNNGARIIQAESIGQVKEFYEILFRLYQTKVKKPLPPFQFFKAFYHSEKLSKYFLIKFNEKIIGGIMCPIYKDTIYEWFVGGLDGMYKNIYPSVLATWAPIEFAAQNGLKYFDFMGAGKPNDDYGVREFKSKFGGELVHYGRYVRVNNRLLYNLGVLGLEILKKIKL